MIKRISSSMISRFLVILAAFHEAVEYLFGLEILGPIISHPVFSFILLVAVLYEAKIFFLEHKKS